MLSRVCRYPKVAHSNKQGNGRETPAHRTNTTGNVNVRAQAWADLIKLEGSERIPLRHRKRFRWAAWAGLPQAEPASRACKGLCLHADSCRATLTGQVPAASRGAPVLASNV